VALSELGRRERRQDARSDAPTRAQLDAFCSVLSEVTGLSIVPYAAPRYDRLVRRLRLGEVELAWLPPVAALPLLRKDAVVVAVPLRGDTPWFWTALFCAEGSPIRDVRTLSGARAMWVDEESASGHLVIRAALQADGLDLTRLFSTEHFAKSHDAVVRAVCSDYEAVGATYLHLDAAGEVARAGWGSRRVRVLKRAGPIPSDLLAASTSLPEAELAALRRALVDQPSAELSAAAAELLGARGFVSGQREHVAHLEALSRYLVRAHAL
jgi:ABC-type phosphate/phosphonate transport system substrate-binding protein